MSGFEGMMDWSIWNNLVLQLSHHDSFIHDSVVAIGALSKALELDRSILNAEITTRTVSIHHLSKVCRSILALISNAYHNVTTTDSNVLQVVGVGPASSKLAHMHKEFAYVKYGKAVNNMKFVLNGSKLREVLVACLLVYCFEVLLNNRHFAMSHILSGHHLLQEWFKKCDPEMPRNRRLLSPEPTAVDDEIVEVFDRMDLQILTIHDLRPVELHRSVIREGLGASQKIPAIFDGLDEARGYLLVVMRRSYHFLATTWPSSQASSYMRDFETLAPGNKIVRTGTNIYSTSFNVSSSIRSEQREFAKDISRWSQAFQPLYQHTRSEEAGFRDHVVSTLLRIHAISTTIVLAGVLFTEETSYDNFLPLFEELLALCTIIVEAYQKKSVGSPAETGFYLDLGITSPLYLLVVRCREHSLRAKAIDLLKAWHVEACWQPNFIAEIGGFLMDVEEDGNENTIIPERSRAVITAVCDKIISDKPERNGEKQALIQCVQRCGGPDGGPIWHERRVRY
jgi:hypothetical protein